MASGTRIARIGTLVSASVVGVVGGHQLGYLAAFPQAEHRRDVLIHTGHGYLPTVGSVLAALAVAAAVTAVVLGFRRRRGHAGSRPGFVASSLTLATVQSVGFAALEVTERVVAGAAVDGFVGSVLWLGLVAQVLIAVVAAAVLVAMDRAGEGLAALVACVVESRPVSRAAARVTTLVTQDHTPYSGRAPPRLLLS